MELGERLLEALGRGARSEGPASGDKLAELVATAKQAWPGIEVDAETFVRYVGERVESNLALDEALEALAALSLPDLYLACACARGDLRALAVFDEHVLSPLAKHVRKLCNTSDDVDEVMQILRTRMLVHKDGETARILSYGGRGPLAGWLRVAAVRVARDLLRARGAVQDVDEPQSVRADDPQPLDPELAVMKARYGDAFRAALSEVLAGLPDRERNILAMSVLDGLSTDAIGALYRVNGSTVRRWLAQARDQVLEEVRERLKATLNVRATEFDSLMGLVRSQLDLNLSQVLGRSRRTPT